MMTVSGSVTDFEQKKRIPESLGFSVAIHLLLLAMVVLFPRWFPAATQRQVTIIELVPENKTAQRPKSRDDERLQNRIVETETGLRAEKAAPDAFLGERTQVVDRQTMSKRSSDPTAAKPGSKQKAPAAPLVAASKPSPEVVREATQPLAKFGVPILPQALKRPEPAAPTRTTGEFGKSPEEYIRGVAEAERTALNTKEFIFFGYYQRIRQRLDMAWVPLLREQIDRIYKRGRQLASEMDHTTRVLVVMNARGEILRVEIKSESGTRDLDDAAIGAFNRAGPFPNPPKGLVDNQGEVQIPWEFILRT